MDFSASIASLAFSKKGFASGESSIRADNIVVQSPTPGESPFLRAISNDLRTGSLSPGGKEQYARKWAVVVDRGLISRACVSFEQARAFTLRYSVERNRMLSAPMWSVMPA